MRRREPPSGPDAPSNLDRALRCCSMFGPLSMLAGIGSAGSSGAILGNTTHNEGPVEAEARSAVRAVLDGERGEGAEPTTKRKRRAAPCFHARGRIAAALDQVASRGANYGAADGELDAVKHDGGAALWTRFELDLDDVGRGCALRGAGVGGIHWLLLCLCAVWAARLDQRPRCRRTGVVLLLTVVSWLL